MPQSASQPAVDKKSAPSARALTSARKQIIDTLKEDHKQVKQAFEAFEKLDMEKDLEKGRGIVEQVCRALQMHTRLEEELVYPAVRESLADEAQMMDEAEIEHQSAKQLIQTLQEMTPEDDPDRYAATFTVLCEYVMHHVKEEEHEMFPKLTRAAMSWTTLCDEFTRRRQALMGEMGMDEPIETKRPTHRGSGSRH